MAIRGVREPRKKRKRRSDWKPKKAGRKHKVGRKPLPVSMRARKRSYYEPKPRVKKPKPFKHRKVGRPRKYRYLYDAYVYRATKKPEILEILEWNLPVYGADGKPDSYRPHGYIRVSNGETVKICHLRSVKHRTTSVDFMFIVFRGIHYKVINDGKQRHPKLRLVRIDDWESNNAAAQRAVRVEARNKRRAVIEALKAARAAEKAIEDEYSDEYSDTVIADDELASEY